MAQYRVKPSKPASAVGMIVGIVFIGIGLFVAIPHAGAFGVFWALVAVVITIFHAINVFSESGIAVTEIIEDSTPKPSSDPRSFDDRLRRLEQLHKDALITDEEYQRKRAELLAERW